MELHNEAAAPARHSPPWPSFKAAGHWTRLIPLEPLGPNNTVSGLDPMLAFPVKYTLPATMLVAPPGSPFPEKETLLFGA